MTFSHSPATLRFRGSDGRHGLPHLKRKLSPSAPQSPAAVQSVHRFDPLNRDNRQHSDLMHSNQKKLELTITSTQSFADQKYSIHSYSPASKESLA